MSEPLVCIILVNYNGFKDTAECIESIKRCTYTNYRIIVVDNNSTEQADSLVYQYIRDNSDAFLNCEINGGFSYGNNIGIRFAENEYAPDYYMLLNNDTIVDPMFLTNLIQQSISYPSADLLTGKIYYYDGTDTLWYAGGDLNNSTARVVHRKYNEVDDKKNVDDNEIVTFASGCLMLIKKQAVKVVGLLDEDFFLYAEDTDYCFRMNLAGIDILYVPTCVIYHKVSRSIGSDSKATQYYMTRNQLYLISKYSCNKVKAYMDNLICDLRYLKHRKKRLPIVIKAYMDYFRKVSGKVK